jgi:hypothetical protein
LRRAAVLLAALALPVSAAAAAPRASLLVVGQSSTLRGPVSVSARAARVTVDGSHCRVGAGTALAALLRAKLPVGLKDYGACSMKPADAAGLYVKSVAGQRERGRSGWVYKLGPSTPSIGAADTSGAFRSGAKVLWFWCRNGPSGCQRTLAVRPLSRSVAAGGTLRVKVTAYDDNGAGKPAAGATVAMGSAAATAGADGVATLTAPSAHATLDVVATQAQLVRSFPARVRVG